MRLAAIFHVRRGVRLLPALVALAAFPSMAGDLPWAAGLPCPFSLKVQCLEPIVYLRLNGNFRDSALPGAHPGVGYGGVTFSGSGGGAPLACNPANRAAIFDGVDDYIAVPSFANLSLTDEATLMAWVKFDRLPSQVGHITTIVAKAGVARDLDLQAEPDDRFYFYIGIGAPVRFVSSQTRIQAGRWYFLVATYRRGDRMDLYVNGVLESTQMGPQVTREENTSPLTIGGSLVWPGRFFPGRIDEVAVFADALAPGQIWRLYQAASWRCGWPNFMNP